MIKNILVFIPDKFSSDKSGFIEGFHKEYADFDVYYITNSEVLSGCKNHIGYTGKFLTSEFLSKKNIFIEHGTKNIQINSGGTDQANITEIFYDYDAFQNSNALYDNDHSYGIHIKELMKKLMHKKANIHSNARNSGVVYWMILLAALFIRIFAKLKQITKNCATLAHLESSTKTLKWFLNTLESERKFSPKIGNVVFARLIDFMLGAGFIYLCLKYKCTIITQVDYISQEFVSNLRELLIYLMGSPIGLKLNYAFNHSLGKFFFYHINLWRVFLHAMQPLLQAHFQLLLLPAVFGMSYQIAVFCDIISLATFHVYCIYVYAARLFSLQIRGISSLWRLFIGRKSNPLRHRVDSCEYSSNQLFIGTLGFTILLFLLPTTTMYYTVFAAFRLITLLTSTSLTKLKDLVGCVPLYIVILWIFRSPSLAGTLQIDWTESINENTHIEAKLAPLSVKESIEKFSCNTEGIYQDKSSFSTIISGLFTGQLV